MKKHPWKSSRSEVAGQNAQRMTNIILLSFYKANLLNNNLFRLDYNWVFSAVDDDAMHCFIFPFIVLYRFLIGFKMK